VIRGHTRRTGPRGISCGRPGAGSCRCSSPRGRTAGSTRWSRR
jgi:hypothetical protein